MFATVKSEFRKLLTVRSTYAIALLSFGLLVMFSFYISGLRASVAGPEKLASDVVGAIAVLATFIAIAGALIMTHEYRYNTILYTLTASKSRLRVLLAKILVVTVFATIFTFIVCVLSPLLSYWGMSIQHLPVAAQRLLLGDLLWRCLFFGWAYGVIGLLLATLIRSQIGTIAAIFFIPSTIEPLLGMLLKEKAMYLPFNALSAVVANIPEMSHAKGAALVTVYIVVAWVTAALLFSRRDAN